MKILVTFWSQTGNTERVARAIFSAVESDKMIIPIEEVQSLEGFDLVFIGFPVMQFGPPRPVKAFLDKYTSGQRIALFVTHAMSSVSDDPQQQALLEKELEKCRKACLHADLTGFFHCRGELSETTAHELISTGIPMLSEFAALQPDTIGHPNQVEMDQACLFARMMITSESAKHLPPTAP